MRLLFLAPARALLTCSLGTALLADREVLSGSRNRTRPAKRVLVDYNQNSWNRTLASVYSVRPKAKATVSAPVTWKEVAEGVEIEDFTMKNMAARLETMGDLWRPLLAKSGRANLARLL